MTIRAACEKGKVKGRILPIPGGIANGGRGEGEKVKELSPIPCIQFSTGVFLSTRPSLSGRLQLHIRVVFFFLFFFFLSFSPLFVLPASGYDTFLPFFFPVHSASVFRTSFRPSDFCQHIPSPSPPPTTSLSPFPSLPLPLPLHSPSARPSVSRCWVEDCLVLFPVATMPSNPICPGYL